MELNFPSKGRLGIYSGDQDVSMRGEDFDLVIIDEAARIREETYLDVIIPTLADRDGRMVLISTPKGRNWFWREWQRGREANDEQIASFQASTANNPNPLIRAAAERARISLPERTYRQEWLAQFLEDGAGVFRDVLLAATALPQEKRIEDHSYTCGVDWGRQDDWTVVTIMDATTHTMAAMERYQGLDYESQLRRLRALYDEWHPYTIVAEANAMGMPLIEQLRISGLPVEPFWTTNKSKMQVIDTLALALERGDITLLDDVTLTSELEAYESVTLEGGVLKYTSPHGMHDDCVISLALAWSVAAAPAAAGVSEERLEEEDAPTPIRRRRGLVTRRHVIGGASRW